MAPTEVTLAPSTEDFDQLWGATVHSVPGVVADPGVPVPAIDLQGDHDGATISAAELRAQRQQAPLANDAPTAVLPVTPVAAGRVRVSTGQVVDARSHGDHRSTAAVDAGQRQRTCRT